MKPTISLRPLAVDDAVVMAEVLADPSLYHFTGGEPPSVDDLRRRYTAQARGGPADGSEVWINSIVALGEARQPIGYVQATVPTDGGAAEIAWVIGVPWQGHGYARRATALLVDDLRARGVTELMAHIQPHHVASERIAARLGLEPTDIVVDGEVRWVGRSG